MATTKAPKIASSTSTSKSKVLDLSTFGIKVSSAMTKLMNALKVARGAKDTADAEIVAIEAKLHPMLYAVRGEAHTKLPGVSSFAVGDATVVYSDRFSDIKPKDWPAIEMQLKQLLIIEGDDGTKDERQWHAVKAFFRPTVKISLDKKYSDVKEYKAKLAELKGDITDILRSVATSGDESVIDSGTPADDILQAVLGGLMVQDNVITIQKGFDEFLLGCEQADNIRELVSQTKATVKFN